MYRSRVRMATSHSRPDLVKTLDLQELGAEIKIYGEIDSPDMRYFNPSIAFHKGELKIAIRSCNFAVEPKGRWYFRDKSAYSKTDVILGDLDPETLSVSNLHKLVIDESAPTRTLVAGLEDVRLYSRNDGLHMIGFESDRLTYSLHNQSASLAEYIVDGNTMKYLRTLKKPDINAVEKNWSPTDVESKNFEFTYSPTQVYHKGQVIGDKYKGIIHGGSQLLKQKGGGYLSLVHDKVMDARLNRPGIYDKYVYRTYLARHDDNGFITELTPPFNFGTHENIEFAAGMVEYKDSFIISFGIRDCKYGIAKVKKSKLTELLKPFKG